MRFDFLKSILFYGAFWMVSFAMLRLLFLLITTLKMGSISIITFETFYYALQLDASAMCYLLAPIVILLIGFGLSKRAIPKRLLKTIIYFQIFLFNAIAIGEACLYTAWKSKLNVQALLHLINPDEVARTAETSLILIFLALVTCSTALGIWVANRIIEKQKLTFLAENNTLLWFLFEITVCVGLLAVLLRGGIQPIPISRSDAMFSNNSLLNDAAINPFWNIANEVIDYNTQMAINPYSYIPKQEAIAIYEEMMDEKGDSTKSILTLQKPNIVFIILESWSAHQSKSLGGGNFTPHFDTLAKSGILFNNCYAAAHVSDQGIPAVLSGLPGLPSLSLINQARKCNSLPSIAKSLKRSGYTSGFVFGGDLNYGNIKSYLFSQGFDKIDDEKTIPTTPNLGRLGANDWEMAKVAIDKISEIKPPFVYGWFTVSSHSPYDIPEPILPLVNHPENNYVNAVKFSDKALGRFFQLARSTTWYKNTLFVLVADYSHHDALGLESFEQEFHRIPLLFIGDCIKPELKGKVWENIVSQVDIVPTLLCQMGLPSTDYRFGKNIFNLSYKPAAFMVHHIGFGLVTSKGYYSNSPCCPWFGNIQVKNKEDTTVIKKQAQATIQVLYYDYLSR